MIPSLAVSAPDEAHIYDVEPPAPDHHYVVTDKHDEVDDYTSVVFLDWTQNVASSYVESLNDGVDSFFMGAFFDDEVLEDETSGSNGRVYFTSRREDQAEPNYQVGLNLRLILPKTRDRFKLLVETDEEEDDVNETDVLGTKDNITYSTAIRVDFKERRHWKTSFDNGVRWAGEPVFFSRLRARRIDYFQTWRTRILQTLSWRTDEKWGTRFSASAIRPLGFSRHFRTGFNADYLLNDDFVELDSSVSVFDELSSRSAMLYRLRVFGDTEKSTKLTNTVLSASYRRKIYKNYTFVELVPELAWPRENDFKVTPAITLQLEMIFGTDD
ncbi:hypothetical protein ACU6U9_12035 [Pseudomonas sp. HK3]